MTGQQREVRTHHTHTRMDASGRALGKPTATPIPRTCAQTLCGLETGFLRAEAGMRLMAKVKGDLATAIRLSFNKDVSPELLT